MSDTKHYSQFRQRIPKSSILTREDEIELFTRLPNEPNLVNEIATRCQRFVTYTALKYRCSTVDVMDLIQEGNLGLLQAIKLYDITMDVPFIAYASIHIKSKIQEYLIKYSKPLPIATTKPQRKLYYQLKRQLNTSLTITAEDRQKLKELCGVNDYDIDKVYGLLTGVVSLDYDYNDSGNLLEDIQSNDIPVEEQIEINDNVDIVYNKLINLTKQLPERDKYVFFKRNVDGDKTTLDTLSKELNISKERVRQLENKVFRFLKNNSELRSLYEEAIS